MAPLAPVCAPRSPPPPMQDPSLQQLEGGTLQTVRRRLGGAGSHLGHSSDFLGGAAQSPETDAEAERGAPRCRCISQLPPRNSSPHTQRPRWPSPPRGFPGPVPRARESLGSLPSLTKLPSRGRPAASRTQGPLPSSGGGCPHCLARLQMPTTSSPGAPRSGQLTQGRAVCLRASRRRTCSSPLRGGLVPEGARAPPGSLSNVRIPIPLGSRGREGGAGCWDSAFPTSVQVRGSGAAEVSAVIPTDRAFRSKRL